MANTGHGFDQNFLSLAVKPGGEDADPRCISIRPGEGFQASDPGGAASSSA